MSVNDEEFCFDNDINAVVDGLKGNGVISGLAVGPRVTPDLYVSVAAGEAIVNGVRVVKTSADVGPATPDGTYPKKVIIVLASDGTLSMVQGTAASALPGGLTDRKTYQPAPPNFTTSQIILAEIWIPQNLTQITSGLIFDRRIIIVDRWQSVNIALSSLLGVYVTDAPWRGGSTTKPTVATAHNATLDGIIAKWTFGGTDWGEMIVQIHLPEKFKEWHSTDAIVIKGYIVATASNDAKVTITPIDTSGTSETSKVHQESIDGSEFEIKFGKSDLAGTYASKGRVRLVLRADSIAGTTNYVYWLSARFNYSTR